MGLVIGDLINDAETKTRLLLTIDGLLNLRLVSSLAYSHLVLDDFNLARIVLVVVVSLVKLEIRTSWLHHGSFCSFIIGDGLHSGYIE